jgi:hypothetical protein
LKFADQLDASLEACGFDCVIDRDGISGGEDWKAEARNAGRGVGRLNWRPRLFLLLSRPSSASTSKNN